jgi:hypothetical protein
MSQLLSLGIQQRARGAGEGISAILICHANEAEWFAGIVE